MQLHSVGPNLINKSKYNSNISNTNSKSYNAKSKDVSFQAREGRLVVSIIVGSFGIFAGLLALTVSDNKKMKMERAKQDSIAKVQQLKQYYIDKAAEESKNLAEHVEKVKRDSVVKTNNMKMDFFISNSEIDEQNIRNAVLKAEESRFGSFDKFVAKNNKKTDEILGIANQYQPTAFTLASIDTSTYDNSKSSSEILAETKRLIALGQKTLSSTMSHDKVVTESGRTVSSTTGHSKSVGGGMAGLLPVVGGSKGSSSSNTTAQSQNTINEFNKVKSDTVIAKIEFERNNSSIIESLVESAKEKSKYYEFATDFLQEEAKKGYSLAKMQEDLNSLSKKVHPKAINIPNKIFNQGTKTVNIKFYVRGLVK